MLICDICAYDIAAYQSARLRERAAPKTVNLEVGTLRAILRKHRTWANIQPDVQMLRVRDYIGRALTADEERVLLAYATNPSKPTGDWKEGWEAAKKRAGVACRFHDLRHTGCTRMLEAGVPSSVVSDIMGWSASTAVRMAKRYGHIGHTARRDAVDKLSNATVFDAEGAQKWAQRQDSGAQRLQ